MLVQIPHSDSCGIIFPASAPPAWVCTSHGGAGNPQELLEHCGCTPAVLPSEHWTAGEGAEKGTGQSEEPASTVCAVGSFLRRQFWDGKWWIAWHPYFGFNTPVMKSRYMGLLLVSWELAGWPADSLQVLACSSFQPSAHFTSSLSPFQFSRAFKPGCKSLMTICSFKKFPELRLHFYISNFEEQHS